MATARRQPGAKPAARKRGGRKPASRRKTTTTPTPPATPPAAAGSTESHASSELSNTDLGLVGREFEQTKEPARAVTAEQLAHERFEPPPPEPFKWDPEKAESVVRIAGLVAHTVDPLSDSPFGPDLWKATEQDCAAIAPPLARILNRYAVARQLAGYSDEAELGAAAWAYGRKNLAARGRVKAMHDRQDAAGNAAHESAYRVEPPPPDEPPPAKVSAPPPTPPPAPPAAAPEPHLAEPTIEVVGAVGEEGIAAGDFDGIAPAGSSGDDIGMFTPVTFANGLMPDLPPDQYE